MCKRWSIRILFFICIFATSLSMCSAYQLQRVAILPIVFVKSDANPEVEAIIASALVNKFKMPLSNIVTTYEIIPAADISAAMPVEINKKKKYSLEKKVLTEVAEKANADIVIAAEVTSYFSNTTTTINGDIIQQTFLGIRVMSYHRPSGKFTDQADYDSYLGDANLWGEPSYIAEQMILKLVNKIPDYAKL